MEKRRLLIGTSNFDKIIEENAFVVDKSLFIKEFMDDPFEVSAILRPRRFGKSLNLSMLKSFFSIGAVSSDFDRFFIANEKEFVINHCGQYPVIFLDLKDCKGETWEKMYVKVCRRIQSMIKRHYSLAQSPANLKWDQFTEGDFDESLLTLTESLYEKFGKRVIVLVDEYDAPLNHAFRKGYYDQASSFFGSFYSQALKGNSALKKACLMGIVEVRGAGILSGLNNINVYSVGDERYSQYFGFTRSELGFILRQFAKPGSLERVLTWYNGYTIGSQTMVNPWSFMKWFDLDKFDSYWVQTSYTETISTILRPYLKDYLLAKFLPLMAEERLPISPLTTKVNYSNENWNLDSIMHFLVLTGYLTYSKQECNVFGEVWIPNKEVLSQWNSDIVAMLNESFAPLFKEILFSIFTSQEFKPAALQEVMQKMLLHCSSHDVNCRNESSYHMFFFGVLFALFHGIEIEVSSNRETGHGRNDIRILFVPMKKCFIFEFKISKAESALEKDAHCGLEQIIDLKYAAESLDKGYDCIGIGIACYREKLSQLKCQLIT